MRRSASSPPSSATSTKLPTRTNDGSTAPITFLPLDLLRDILLDSLPPPATPSGRVKEDALQLVRRTKRLHALRAVCRAWRSLLSRLFFSGVGVSGTTDLVALAQFVKEYPGEAARMEKLLVIGQPTTDPANEAVKAAFRTLLKVCSGLKVLCLVEVEVQVSVFTEKNTLDTLFLYDCLIGDDLSYRRLVPALLGNKRPKLPCLTHLTVDGCLFVYRAGQYLRKALPSSGLVGCSRHNALHDLSCARPLHDSFVKCNSTAATEKETSLSPLFLTLGEHLSCLSIAPSSWSQTSLSFSSAAQCLSLPLSAQLALLRLSPIETLHLDFNVPLEGHVVWTPPVLSDALLGTRAVRQHPGSQEALGLVKELVAILQADVEEQPGGERVFPQLKMVVLPYSWGSEATFDEYYDSADLPYHLAKLKSLVEARGVEWVAKTAEQASVWGKARFAWAVW